MRRENFPCNKTLCEITCECGFEIPIVPNAEIVGNAVDAHAEEHKRRKSNEIKGKKEAERIRNLLIQKIFENVVQVCN